MGLVGGGATEVAGKISDLVAKWIPDTAQRAEATKALNEAFNSARAHDTPANSGIQIVDALVNGVNRMIRPGVTIGLIGGVLGWWDLPDPKGIDPVYFHFTEIVLLFWFGGRALFKDLPAMMKYLKR